jgi:pimeloyl-ACP methyl ester carboxylesterase
VAGFLGALGFLMAGHAAAQAGGARGDWVGAVTVKSGAVSHLAFHIEAGASGLTGTMEALDQGLADLPLTQVEAKDGHLAFEAPTIGAHYAGAWDAAAGGYVGQWSRGATTLPLTLVHGPTPSHPVVTGLDGAWDGALDVGALGKLRLVFTISTGSTGTVGNLRSVDQGGFPGALTSIVHDGTKVTFEIKAIGGVFEGDLSADGQTLTGQWTQSGRTFPLTLTRRAAGAAGPAAYARPQLPKPPFPYRSVEVGYDNPAGHNHLAGTLTLPQGAGPFPAALLITGSGLQDRDETVAGHKPFLVLADYLSRRGIAVLRVDDRTMGGSTGDVVHATSADFATDVEAGVAFLKTRPEIDAKKIGLIGHSEGGMIAPMVAVKDPHVAWIVLMAGPGIPGDRLLTEQGRLIALAMGVAPDIVARNGALNAKVYAAIKNAKDAREAHDQAKALLIAAGLSDAAAEAAVAPAATDWFRFFFNYDPAPTLAKVRVPILAIDGSLDLQVPPKEDLAAIKAATSANPDVTTLELPGLNHLFQTARTGAPSEYQSIEETVSPAALKVIGDWIEAHTR